ncbi:MAG: STAS domain-containing protein [Gemmatimonadales bacterium]
MQMTVAHDGPVAVVRLAGRIDGDCAAQLADTLEQLLREGSRAAALDLREINYISTPGLQAIAGAHQEYAAVRGDLRITGASPLVRGALEAAEMGGMLSDRGTPSGTQMPSRMSSVLSRSRSGAATWSLGGTNTWQVPRNFMVRGRYEVAEASFRLTPPTVSCRLVGEPDWMASGGIPRSACRALSFGEDAFGLGVGALGPDVDDALPRLGELIAAQGVVATHPTDGATLPDFMLGLSGQPATAVLGSGMVFEGPFARTVRFAKLPEHDAVSLCEVANVCCELADGGLTAMVMMTEVSGLVGAWLRRSPGGDEAGFSTSVPVVRDWIGVSPEHIHEGTSALVVGVVAKTANAGALAPWLRPLGERSGCVGHFHASVFSYRPVPLRTVQPRVVVSKYFTQQRARAVMHLLTDDRGVTGAGQSEFLRGICWTSPVSGVEAIP